MFEKVNKYHPDKVADRIAGAIVDLAYKKNDAPKCAVEVLLGHGKCHVIVETSETFSFEEVDAIVKRIVGSDCDLDLQVVPQDVHLAENQSKELHCGDNGIFKGCPVTGEQRELSILAHNICDHFSSDGKYVLSYDEFIPVKTKLIVCQSNATEDEILNVLPFLSNVVVNPLGDWTGGYNVDTGATNRKLGSDMGDGVTGGGLHGKDLSKADVSVNIVCHLLAQENGVPVTAYCAIGDSEIKFVFGETSETKIMNFNTIVHVAQRYINQVGGFEKFAEWGLI